MEGSGGGRIVGIVGFSQGGAMAAQLANRLHAQWALLFSPIYAAGHPAQCDCPTLVAFDRADEVFDATETLLSELDLARERPSSASASASASAGGGLRMPDVQRLEHHEGHRLPADAGFYGPIADFVERHTPK